MKTILYQLLREVVMLNLLPLNKTVQINNNLLLNLHLILQLIYDSLLYLRLFINFVKLYENEFELFNQVLLDLFEAFLDINMHLGPKLHLNILHVALMAFL